MRREKAEVTMQRNERLKKITSLLQSQRYLSIKNIAAGFRKWI